MLCSHGNASQLIIIIMGSSDGRDHDHHLRKWMILFIQVLYQMQRTIVEPFRDDKSDLSFGGRIWRIQFSPMYYILAAEMARNQIGCSIVVDCWSEFVCSPSSKIQNSLRMRVAMMQYEITGQNARVSTHMESPSPKYLPTS